MILKIVFLILFLLGVSLFFSTVATIILRKRSRVVRRKLLKGSSEAILQPGEGEKVVNEEFDVGEETEKVSKNYRRRYLDKVSEVEVPSAVPEAGAGSTGAEIHPRVTYSVAKRPSVNWDVLKWFGVIFIAAVILFSSVIFGYRLYRARTTVPKIYFCESVDFKKLKPVKKSDRFTRGKVTLFYKSKIPLDCQKIVIEVYKLGPAGFTPYYKNSISVKPEWNSFITELVFDTTGNYMVELKKEGDKLLAQKLVEIVPDSYAFKARVKK